jgi:hypothetical protein
MLAGGMIPLDEAYRAIDRDTIAPCPACCWWLPTLGLAAGWWIGHPGAGAAAVTDRHPGCLCTHAPGTRIAGTKVPQTNL